MSRTKVIYCAACEHACTPQMTHCAACGYLLVAPEKLPTPETSANAAELRAEEALREAARAASQPRGTNIPSDLTKVSSGVRCPLCNAGLMKAVNVSGHTAYVRMLGSLFNIVGGVSVLSVFVPVIFVIGAFLRGSVIWQEVLMVVVPAPCGISSIGLVFLLTGGLISERRRMLRCSVCSYAVPSA